MGPSTGRISIITELVLILVSVTIYLVSQPLQANASPSMNVAIIGGTTLDTNIPCSSNGSAANNMGATSGGCLPVNPETNANLEDFSFAPLAPTDVNANNLSGFDTVVLNMASSALNCNSNNLSATAKTDLIAFVGEGKKLIIYDSQCNPGPDYNWLPFPFVTNNPGVTGTTKGSLAILENNMLSSNSPSGPAFIDADALATFTNAAADMNLMTTRDPHWCLDISGTNAHNVRGAVHVYAKFPSDSDAGLFLYNGLAQSAQSSGNPILQKIWLLELQQSVNPSNLACSFIVAHENNSRLNQQGSLLVFPLVDTLTNESETIINMTNTSNQGVWVECHTVLHGAFSSTAFIKSNFQIFLTPFQKIWWRFSEGYSPAHLVNQFGFPPFSIPPHPGEKGFLYCFAIQSSVNPNEKNFNFLKGDTLIFDEERSFNYNAISHQAIAITPDRTLNLDGVEYTQGSSRIWLEGIPEEVVLNGGEITGTLTLASIQMDLKASLQTEFGVNYRCWNRKEQAFTRHRGIFTFAQQDLTEDLGINVFTIRSNAFMCRADTFQTGLSSLITGKIGDRTPVWAVFHQSASDINWGTNVFHDPDPAFAAPAKIVLNP